MQLTPQGGRSQESGARRQEPGGRSQEAGAMRMKPGVKGERYNWAETPPGYNLQFSYERSQVCADACVVLRCESHSAILYITYLCALDNGFL